MTRKEQKEFRRQQIFQTALCLFVQQGYYGTKTSQISKCAGISEGLLFHYFPTKENPFVAQMFIFMAHVVKSEDIPPHIRQMAVSVDPVQDSCRRIKEGQADGSIRPGDPMALSNLYWCCVHGLMEQYSLNPDIPLPNPEWILDILRAKTL